MFNNTSCIIFKNNLDNLISESQLPPLVAYYIIKDSLHSLQDTCQQVIQYEKKDNEQFNTQEINLLNEEDKKKLQQLTAFSKSLKADQQDS